MHCIKCFVKIWIFFVFILLFILSLFLLLDFQMDNNRRVQQLCISVKKRLSQCWVLLNWKYELYKNLVSSLHNNLLAHPPIFWLMGIFPLPVQESFTEIKINLMAMQPLTWKATIQLNLSKSKRNNWLM